MNVMSWSPAFQNRKSPEVSVVMPSFNHREFIQEAIASVLSQDVSLELLIQDDCSTDGTWELIREVMDPRVLAVQTAHNRASHPRNFARGLVKGRYVAFLNSDDRWAPGKLKAQLDCLRRAPERSIAFTRARFVDHAGAAFNVGWNFVSDIPNRHWLLRKFFDDGNCVALPSAVIPTAFLHRLGWFHPAMLQASDWDLWIRALFRADAVEYITEVLTDVRYLGARNLSSNPALTTRVEGELLAALDNYISHRALLQFRHIFDSENNVRLPFFSRTAKRIVIARRAMAAQHRATQVWGVLRYQELLRRHGYRNFAGNNVLNDYDSLTRRR